MLSLTPQEALFISLFQGLVLLHLLLRMVRQRSLADFFLFTQLALTLALFLMETLYLKLPLLDILLAVVMGVLGGLHLIRLLPWQKWRGTRKKP